MEILRALKEINKKDGVLIISARHSLDDKLDGLNLGADDYLVKPFHLSELKARVTAIVRRKSYGGSNIKPFYGILLQMKAFNLADKNDVHIEPTKIDEFAELNAAVVAMSLRVKQDYRELKSFTDNASHEMMTPLAVINSKLDTLIQTETFSDSQGELIEDIYVAVGKLSRLNQSLLMLAKIENNLIGDQEIINLDELIRQKTRQFQELLQSQEINLRTELAKMQINMNKHLADMLINNLLSNAIRHNYNGGKIHIHLNEKELTVSNTGSDDELIVSKVFERFYKNAASEGMGLGLAISNQICNLYHFKLNYTYDDTRHTFKVSF